MENVFRYYNFSSFIKDQSNAFLGNNICFTELNNTHFLIFEKQKETYNLYVSKYENQQEIGKKKPQILELLVTNYNKSLPEHRILLRKYLE